MLALTGDCFFLTVRNLRILCEGESQLEITKSVLVCEEINTGSFSRTYMTEVVIAEEFKQVSFRLLLHLISMNLPNYNPWDVSLLGTEIECLQGVCNQQTFTLASFGTTLDLGPLESKLISTL